MVLSLLAEGEVLPLQASKLWMSQLVCRYGTGDDCLFLLEARASPPSFFFGYALVGVSLLLCAKKMQSSFRKCLGGFIRVRITHKSWLSTQVSIMKGRGDSIRGPVLSWPPAARKRSATACGTLTAPRPTWTWRLPGSSFSAPSTTTQHGTRPLCVVLTHWTPR